MAGPCVGKNAFQQGLKVVDCGDAPLTVLDNTIALKQLGRAHEIVSNHKANATKHGIPRIIL